MINIDILRLYFRRPFKLILKTLLQIYSRISNVILKRGAFLQNNILILIHKFQSLVHFRRNFNLRC